MAKMGAPTKYKKKYIKELIEYFDVEAMTKSTVTITTKSGSTIEKEEFIPTTMPTIERFLADRRIPSSTFYDWLDRYPDLSEAYNIIKLFQKDILVKNGLMGTYKEGFTKFYAVNCTDLVDTSKIEVKNEATPDLEEVNERLDNLITELGQK